MIKQVVFIFLFILFLGCAKRSYVDNTFFTIKNNHPIYQTNDKFQILSASLKDILIDNPDNIIFNNLDDKEKIYLIISKHQKQETLGKNIFYSLDTEKDYPQEIKGIQFSVKTFTELRKIAKRTSSFNAIEFKRLGIMDEKYAELVILLYTFPDTAEGDFKYLKLALKKVDSSWIVHKRRIENSLR